MTWTNAIWLLVGLVGGGLLGYWAARRQRAVPRSRPSGPPPLEPPQPDPTELALTYQMASELSQFKGGFLARTSHELRSPLNGIIGMHQLILADLCESPEEAKEFVAQANTAALRMVNVLDELIEVSKFAHGTFPLEVQPVCLETLLAEVYTLTHLQAQNRNLQLQVQPGDPEIYVLADPKCLRQVLVHLLDRAISQMQEGALALQWQVAPAGDRVHFWVQTPQLADPWGESADFLETDYPRSAPLPSPGLTLLSDQQLMALMAGELVLREIPATAPDHVPGFQLRCAIPRVVETM